MNKILNNKRLVGYIRNILVFIIVAFISYIAISEDYFSYVRLAGLPIQSIEKLFIFHIIANGLLFLATSYLALLFFKIYIRLKARGFPFTGFIWIFGAFKVFIASIFFMNILSIWRAYYWIDGTIRVFAGLFAISAAVILTKSYKQIVSIKSPIEYAELRNEIRRVFDIQEKVIETKISDKNESI